MDRSLKVILTMIWSICFGLERVYRAIKDGRDFLTPLIVAYDIRKLVELGSMLLNIDFRKPHYDGEMKSTFMGYKRLIVLDSRKLVETTKTSAVRIMYVTKVNHFFFSSHIGCRLMIFCTLYWWSSCRFRLHQNHKFTCGHTIPQNINASPQMLESLLNGLYSWRRLSLPPVRVAGWKFFMNCLAYTPKSCRDRRTIDCHDVSAGRCFVRPWQDPTLLDPYCRQDVLRCFLRWSNEAATELRKGCTYNHSAVADINCWNHVSGWPENL